MAKLEQVVFAESLGVSNRSSLTKMVTIGGEPFVLLFESITFGTPAGKKEIEV